MKTTGYYAGAAMSLDGELILSMKINEKTDAMDKIVAMDRERLMDIEIKPHRKKRSLDANTMFWACIGEIASALNLPREKVYLKALRDYGQYEIMSCKKKAFRMFQRQYKDCEQIGYEYTNNGEVWVDVICYFGSHTYDTKQFSLLLEGVIGDMKELGLAPPPPKSVQKGLELWEAQTQRSCHSAT